MSNGFNDPNLEALSESIRGGLDRISSAITADAGPGHDDTGGTVWSLTEAVMGITSGLCKVAAAIQELAEAVKEK